MLFAVLAQDAPSNDEVMGFVIVFGLMFLCFMIAKFFGPGHSAPESEYGIANKGPVSTVIGIIVILVIFYFVGRFLAMAHQ